MIKWHLFHVFRCIKIYPSWCKVSSLRNIHHVHLKNTLGTWTLSLFVKQLVNYKALEYLARPRRHMPYADVTASSSWNNTFVHKLISFHSNDDIQMMKRIFTRGDPQDVTQETRYILEEEHDFELCVHTRNFIGGTAIATNITLAVQRSRRTIVLLTEYVGF